MFKAFCFAAIAIFVGVANIPSARAYSNCGQYTANVDQYSGPAGEEEEYEDSLPEDGTPIIFTLIPSLIGEIVVSIDDTSRALLDLQNTPEHEVCYVGYDAAGAHRYRTRVSAWGFPRYSDPLNDEPYTRWAGKTAN